MKRTKRIFLSATIFCSCFLFGNCAVAASLYVNPPLVEVRSGQEFQVDFLLNTENEDLNAMEGSVEYPSDLLEVKSINDGGSIINFWVERPSVVKSKVNFSGIVPGGYNGAQGLLFSTTFFAKKNGSGIIKFEGMKILRNDGLGTEAEVKISNLEFVISDEGARIVVPTVEDNVAPEQFAPEIARDSAIFNGKYFLAFSAADKGSGIDYYQVKEERRYKIGSWEIKCGRWKVAVSPYLLRDQVMRSAIYIKATDKSGNERIVSLAPRTVGSDLIDLNLLSEILIGILFIVLIVKLCVTHFRKK